ncbi:MAG: ABC transporter ATP-binding protein/permease [Butyrivibrio sp.]|nr:ABC transporter ATP-binding protein/permease [Butyrivibrio sp.]
MKEQKKDVQIKQEKGVWKRYIILLFKARIPIVWLLIYIAAEVFLVNVGVSETDYTAKLFDGDVSVKTVMSLVAVIVINMVFSSVSVLIREILSARTNRNARLAIWNKLLHIPMKFFNNENPEEAISRIVSNATCVDSTLIFVLVPIGTTAYSIFACVKKVWDYDWRLSATLLCSIPLAILVAFITGRLKYSVNKSGANVLAVLTERISELIKRIPMMKAFAREKAEEARGDDVTGRLYRVNVKSGWIDNFSSMGISLLGIISNLLIVLVGVILFKNDAISKRAWIAFFLFSGTVMGHVDALILYWHNTKTIQGIIARVGEIMSYENEKSGTLSADGLTGDIRFEGVSFGYNEDKPVLEDVDCTFKEGTVTALLGLSGCGKSTMVNLIDRIYEPDKGAITIGGSNIADYEISSYRRLFGMIPQNVMLFSGTVRENVTFGVNRSVADDEIMSALCRVGLADFMEKSGKGLELDIGERGCKLSGGQKQKIALARMLLADSHYLILDEATASMDSISVADFRSVLEEIVKDRTVIIIAHTNHLMSLAEEAMVIENGRIAACGKFDKVLEENAFLRDFMKGADVNEE